MVQTVLQEQILEKLNALIVVMNTNGHAEYISDSACRLLGFNRTDLLGDNWWEVTRFSKPEGELTRKKMLSIMRAENHSDMCFEHRLKTYNGLMKWISWKVSFLNEDQIIGIGQDITEKKENERQMLETNKLLVQQNKEIVASIHYAKRIQQSSQQSGEYMRKIFSQSFVLYKPKDIVSGDWYYFFEDEESKYAFAIDCTGHGVPGAMMSMVANSIINEVMINKKLKHAGAILYELDRELFKALNAYNDEISYDGMDISVIRITKRTNRLHYAGAFRPITLLRNGEANELKPSRFPLGYYSGIEKRFEEQVLMLNDGDIIYMYSDGYADQFGGEGEGKKLNKRNFKDLLQTAAQLDMDEQESFLEYSLNNWKQNREQTDDVLVIGIKI